MVHFGDVIEPIEENVALYNKIFDIYKNTYHGLNDKGVFKDLAKL